MTKLRQLAAHRLLWGFTGIAALSALIWILGPLLPLGDSHLLDNSSYREGLIAACWFAWVLLQLIPFLYRRWFNSRMLQRLAQDDLDRAEQHATRELLDGRFGEAAALLKNLTFNPPDHAQPRRGWLARLQGQYLYEMPWYLMLGAPGAGKTTALVNSGLAFPLQNSLGKTAIRGVGGTRHCDWWFTDRAVLLDTAGRYSLHEGQHARDASEWQTFVGLLKRYRTRQPINGVILTISVADLLSESAEVRHAQASALRQRLHELHQQTGIHFPVYVMVTKTDLLRGFMSYFSRMDKSQRDQIWGFTFPWDPQRQQEARLHARFDSQFDALATRLTLDLAQRMTHDADLSQRAECFLFPQQFSLLRPLLAEYLDIVFDSHSGPVAWSVRGLFFTSGTQEGLAFDRVMGELNRKLQLPQQQSQTIAAWDSVNRNAPIPGNKGQSFFIHDMLEQVIFRERGLAGSDRSWEHRNRLFHWSGYAALTGGLLLAVCCWVTSYLKNQQYLDQIADRLPRLTEQAQQLSRQHNESMLDLLTFLNSLVALPQTGDLALDKPPMSMRAGLYRGEQMSDAAWSLYQNALKSLLMPRVAQVITSALRDDKGSDTDYSRNALRAYQMLYQPRSYDGEFLRGWVMQNLQRSLPASVTSRELQQLDWHLSQLLDRQIQTSPYARDNALMMHKLALNLRQAGQRDDNNALILTAHPLTERR